MDYLGFGLAALAGVGIFALWIQWALLRSHCGEAPPSTRHARGISILKPLCGLDDDLEGNLESFRDLDYPVGHFEVLLGVKDPRDPAFGLARRLARRYPEVFRCVLQQGEPGLNPKVNQLVTLERRARFPILVVSDSNVRVERAYLRELSAHFADPSVGCVTHPVAGAGGGAGERSLGALLDNLHLASSVAAGMVAAQRVLGKDLVVGKSMALRSEDLRALGGFGSVSDYLAEDHVLGNRIGSELGKRVVVSPRPIHNVATRKSVGDFFRRYRRWAVIHRTAVSPGTYFAQALLNPVPLALLALLVSPSRTRAVFALAVGALKIAVDLACARTLGAASGPITGAPAVLLKDGLLFAAWVHGLFARTVEWRGNPLRVTTGSRLLPPEAPLVPALP